MRTRMHVLAVLGLTLTVAGCGDSSTTSSSTPPPVLTAAATTVATTTAATTATAHPVAAERLAAMLLGSSDVGKAWALGPAVNEADFTDLLQVPCPDTAVNPTILGRLTGQAGVQFSPADGSYKHLIETLVSGEPRRLAADLDALFGAVQSCPPTSDVATPTYRDLALPELGDQRMGSVFIGVVSTDATWYVRTANVRVGDVALTIALTEILASVQDPPTITDSEFATLVTAAVGKLAT